MRTLSLHIALVLLLGISIGANSANAVLKTTYTFQGYSSSALRAELHETENFQGYPYYNLTIKVINNTGSNLFCSGKIGSYQGGFDITNSASVPSNKVVDVVSGTFNRTSLSGSPSNENSVSCRNAEEDTGSGDLAIDGGGTTGGGDTSERWRIQCPCSYRISGGELYYSIDKIFGRPEDAPFYGVVFYATTTPYSGGPSYGYPIANEYRRLIDIGNPEWIDGFSMNKKIDSYYGPPNGQYYITVAVVHYDSALGASTGIAAYRTFPDLQTFSQPIVVDNDESEAGSGSDRNDSNPSTGSGSDRNDSNPSTGSGSSIPEERSSSGGSFPFVALLLIGICSLILRVSRYR